MLARQLQGHALFLQLPEQLGVQQRQRRLAGEGLQQVDDARGEVAGALAPHDQRADDRALAKQGDGDERGPSGAVQDLQVRVELHGREVGNDDRAPLQRGSPDERLVDVDPHGAQLLDDLGSCAVDAAHDEPAVPFVVLHDRAAVGAGQCDRTLGDRVENVLEVEGGADRLADRAERLQLVDLAGQLRSPRLELLDQTDAVDGDGRLNGERADDAHLTVVERADLVAPHVEGADHHVVDDQGRGNHGAESRRSLQVVAAEVRVGQHVGDLERLPLQADASGECLPVHRDRVLGQHLPGRLGEPDRPHEAEGVAVQQVEMRGLRPAQPSRVLDDGGEHRVRIGCRLAHGLEHLGRGAELVSQGVVVPAEPLVFRGADGSPVRQWCRFDHGRSSLRSGTPRPHRPVSTRLTRVGNRRDGGPRDRRCEPGWRTIRRRRTSRGRAARLF